MSYLANNRTLCCKQVTNVTMVRENLTNRTFHIYHNLKHKSKYVIYLLECTKYKIQYVGKAETEFSIKLKNNQMNAWKSDAIPARRNFSDKNHSFNTRPNFILIEQIRHNNIYRKIYKDKLKQIKLLDINTRNCYA